MEFGYINQSKARKGKGMEHICDFRVKDPMSALTHAIGFAAAIILMPIILTHASYDGASLMAMVSVGIFMISTILLYGASTSYHTFGLSDAGVKRLKKLDHAMIFVLIAGTYTPICTIALPAETGNWMLILIWSIAIAGIVFKFFWVTCPKWVSSVIYIAMGWVCIFAFPQLWESLSAANFFWLLGGGIAYTVGGVIYGMQKILRRKETLKSGKAEKKSRFYFGPHEVFHIFVMAGTACHFIVVYNLV